MQRGKSSPIEFRGLSLRFFAWVEILACNSGNSRNSSWTLATLAEVVFAQAEVFVCRQQWLGWLLLPQLFVAHAPVNPAFVSKCKLAWDILICQSRALPLSCFLVPDQRLTFWYRQSSSLPISSYLITFLVSEYLTKQPTPCTETVCDSHLQVEVKYFDVIKADPLSFMWHLVAQATMQPLVSDSGSHQPSKPPPLNQNQVTPAPPSTNGNLQRPPSSSSCHTVSCLHNSAETAAETFYTPAFVRTRLLWQKLVLNVTLSNAATFVIWSHSEQFWLQRDSFKLSETWRSESQITWKVELLCQIRGCVRLRNCMIAVNPYKKKTFGKIYPLKYGWWPKVVVVRSDEVHVCLFFFYWL